MTKEHEVTKFRTDVALREKSSDSMFSDKLRFIYLSLPFFDKSEEECETGFEKWIYVLKYMEVLERLPFTAQKKIFNHLAKLEDVRCLSSEEQEKYDESIKAVDDYYSGLYDFASDYEGYRIEWRAVEPALGVVPEDNEAKIATIGVAPYLGRSF